MDGIKCHGENENGNSLVNCSVYKVIQVSRPNGISFKLLPWQTSELLVQF